MSTDRKKTPPKFSDKTPYTVGNDQPRKGKKGYLCADGTYNVDCCDDALWAQGIGEG